MGVSGYVINKNGEKTIEELLHEVRTAAERTGSEYSGSGIPAFLLKRDGDKLIHEIIHDVQIAAEKADLECLIDTRQNAMQMKDASDTSAVCTIIDGYGVSNKQKLKLIIRSMGRDKTEYNWVKDGGSLIPAVTFESINENEEILLYFLYEYFKLNPEDYLVVGNTVTETCKWCFTAKEVEKIWLDIQPHGYHYEDNLWCYSNPQLKGDTV